MGTLRVAPQICGTPLKVTPVSSCTRGPCHHAPCPQALTERRKLLVQSQAGLQPRAQQLHRQLHVAGAQRVVRSDCVLWAGGTITISPASRLLLGTPRSQSHPSQPQRQGHALVAAQCP